MKAPDNLRTGMVRGVLAVGESRGDGYVPVKAAVTMSPKTALTRVLLVPEADVSRLGLGMKFLWALVDGEAVVVAVGRDAVEMFELNQAG